MTRAGVIGVVLLGAAPSTAAAAPAVDPISVSRSMTVPAGATRSLTLTCPGAAVALKILGFASSPILLSMSA